MSFKRAPLGGSEAFLWRPHAKEFSLSLGDIIAFVALSEALDLGLVEQSFRLDVLFHSL